MSPNPTQDNEQIGRPVLDLLMHISTFPPFPFHRGNIQLKWVTESTDETPEDVVPGSGHWSTFGLDGRNQPDNWLYRTSPPPADEAKVRRLDTQLSKINMVIQVA